MRRGTAPYNEGMWFVLGWLMAVELTAAPPSEQQLLRLAEEAEAFARVAPEIIGQEQMEQILLLPPPRFRERGQVAPPPKFRRRRLLSEYGFTIFKDDGNLHELRQVLQVDGKQVKKPGALRQTLSMGMKGEADRLKKKLLKDFEGYGLPQAATDFGQMILLFTKRQIPNYTFDIRQVQYQGADQVHVVAYEQKAEDATAMTVFEAHRVMDEIEDKLLAEFPDIEILIHPDPEGLVDETGLAAREVLTAEVAASPARK